MIRVYPAFASHRPARQRGLALFVGLVFLVVLSLVAVIAMQSTFLEMRMVTNVARQTEAFQMSESGRSVLTAPTQESLFSQSLRNGGWPDAGGWGGDVPATDFSDIGNCQALTGWTTSSGPGSCSLITNFRDALLAAQGSPPKLLYGALDLAGADGLTPEDPTNPSNWAVDAKVSLTDPQSPSDFITAALSVVPDGGGLIAGAGSAQAAGYRGLGVAAAAGGAARYFQIQSVGTAPANGRAVTIAQYEAVVQ